jgi:hypothetical protein
MLKAKVQMFGGKRPKNRPNDQIAKDPEFGQNFEKN